jgi:hypothetical protein
MVPDAGCGLRREKVAAGGLEELQHRCRSIAASEPTMWSG